MIFNPNQNSYKSFSIPTNHLTKAEYNILKAIFQEWSSIPTLDSLLDNWSKYCHKTTSMMNIHQNVSLLLLNVSSLSRYLIEVFNLIDSTTSPIIIPKWNTS